MSPAVAMTQFSPLLTHYITWKQHRANANCFSVAGHASGLFGSICAPMCVCLFSCVWKSEVYNGCLPWSLLLQQVWPATLAQDPPVLPLLYWYCIGGGHTCQMFIWVLGIGTLVLSSTLQLLYAPSHLSSPRNSFFNLYIFIDF